MRDSAIYEWEHGEEMGADLVEISEAEAERLIEGFRQKWGAAASLRQPTQHCKPAFAGSFSTPGESALMRKVCLLQTERP